MRIHGPDIVQDGLLYLSRYDNILQLMETAPILATEGKVLCYLLAIAFLVRYSFEEVSPTEFNPNI